MLILLCYEVSCLIATIYLSVAGIIGWFELFNVDIANAKDNPFFGHSDYVQSHLIIPLLVYQGLNALVCVLVKDLRKLEMISHHLLAFLLALCGMNSFLHYWAIFFFGITEISSIPLTIMSIMRILYGKNKNEYYAYKISRSSFALLFIIIRLIYWPVYYTNCIYEAIYLYSNNKLNYVYFYTFTIISTALTGLQLYWGTKIVNTLVTKKAC